MKCRFVALLVLLSGACAGSPAKAPESRAASSATQISFVHGCAGYITQCPAYGVTIKPDGAYIYEGYNDLAGRGVHEGMLSPDAFDRAEAALAAANWSRLPDSLSRDDGGPCMPDSPSAQFRRRDTTGNEKIVVYNLGCNSTVGNKLLDDLEAALPRDRLAPPPAPASKASIRLSESPCFFPTCVVYEIELRPDGSYRLDAKANTRNPGVSEGKLDADAWARAEAAFIDAKFAGMPDRLTSETLGAQRIPCINDLPAAEFTRVDSAGVSKTVHYNTGCAAPAARKLLDDLRAAFQYEQLVRKP